jgi:hypothetical protein
MATVAVVFAVDMDMDRPASTVSALPETVVATAVPSKVAVVSTAVAASTAEPVAGIVKHTEHVKRRMSCLPDYLSAPPLLVA